MKLIPIFNIACHLQRLFDGGGNFKSDMIEGTFENMNGC